MILITTIFDLLATTCGFFGLTLVAASVAQMTNGLVVVFTAIISYFLLRKTQEKHQVLAIILITLGIFLVGMASRTNSETNDNPFIGIFLIALG